MGLTIILQNRLQSLAIIDIHFLAISSALVALLINDFTCQEERSMYELVGIPHCLAC